MNGIDKRRNGNGMTALCGALVAVAMLAAAGQAAAAPAAVAQAPAVAASAKVDVNTAGAAELASLPGIGDSKAAAIIAEREKKPFASVEDLVRVRGIGERTVEDLRGKVSVGTH